MEIVKRITLQISFIFNNLFDFKSLLTFLISFSFLRKELCKILVDVYGADVDIRDFAGKKAFHYLKQNQPKWQFHEVCVIFTWSDNIIKHGTLWILMSCKNIYSFKLEEESVQKNWSLCNTESTDYVNGFFGSLSTDSNQERPAYGEYNSYDKNFQRKTTERSSSFFRSLLPKHQVHEIKFRLE